MVWGGFGGGFGIDLNFRWKVLKLGFFIDFLFGCVGVLAHGRGREVRSISGGCGEE